MENNGDNRETVNPSFTLGHPLDFSFEIVDSKLV